MVYGTLFTVAFLAATILPAGSEALLLALANQGHALWGLWAVATLGNSLGALVNYWIGRALLHFQDRKWFPINAQQRQRSQAWFQRYGVGALLFAWLPIIGDPLTVIAGMMRVQVGLFVVLVTLGKALRYGFLLGLLQFWAA